MDSIFGSIKEFLSYGIYPGEKVNITVGTILVLLIGLVVANFVLKMIKKIVTKKLPDSDRSKFVSIFGFLKYLFYILIAVIVLHTSGVDLTVLLTASAALFVGLGFALQYLFQDIISGILIILDQSLHVGDIVEVEGKVGRVFDIKLRTTRAMTRDDKVIVIPNHIFMTDSIYNYTQNHPTTREALKIGVAYGSDVKKVTKILEGIADENESVLQSPPPFVQFDDFGDSALLFSLNFYINDSFRDPRIKSELRYRIDAEFKDNNITIPFPQRDVHVYQQSPFQHSRVDNSNKEWGLADD